jgi:hypothetical protein
MTRMLQAGRLDFLGKGVLASETIREFQGTTGCIQHFEVPSYAAYATHNRG